MGERVPHTIMERVYPKGCSAYIHPVWVVPPLRGLGLSLKNQMTSKTLSKKKKEESNVKLGRVIVISKDESLKEKVPVYLNNQWPTAAVVSVEEIKQGVKLIRKTTPDLVIFDDASVEDDESATIGEIKSLRDTPVIILTDKGKDHQRVARYMDEGAIVCERKPLKSRVLVSRIKAVCRKIKASAPSSSRPVKEADTVHQPVSVPEPAIPRPQNGESDQQDLVVSSTNTDLMSVMTNPSFRRKVIQRLVKTLS